MTTFEYEPERLIEEVKKRPGIWDSDDPGYKSKNQRHRLWLEVIREVAGKDINVSKSELRELELQIQKKWKSIRDCFQKYLVNPNRSRRPYIYSRQLEFLLKRHTLPKRDGSSDSEDGAKRSHVIDWKHKKKLRLSRPSSDEEDTYEDERQDDIEVEIPNLSNNSKPMVTEFAFANVDARDVLSKPNLDGEEPEKMFLLSLLPHLKAIPEQYRLNVKMDIMQVIRNASYQVNHDQKSII
ncbi:uncharacterized protein LOC126979940 [Leptidea sinapis]|uniref:BESS domain-containing protein n=1 Tax=Leptidea sinapis TaxID=189913 RepID=A0A5E4QJN8_9NEOP|nr:uncharacterized protein LOC126979940 [Leptidea sinapis]VVC97318.1 unnamed protein product [Leptidea sinapis]